MHPMLIPSAQGSYCAAIARGDEQVTVGFNNQISSSFHHCEMVRIAHNPVHR
jgi:hypothetical protein